ncbi:MAG: heavy metal translocating P-type ATPase [Syntrophomonas sp.]
MPESIFIDQSNIVSKNINVTGLDCHDCAAKVEKAVRRVPGVIEAIMIFPNGILNLKYNSDSTAIINVINTINTMGYGAYEDTPGNCTDNSVAIRLSGLDCADCAAKLEKRISMIPGVELANVNFANSKLDVTYSGPISDVLSVVEKLGYQGVLEEEAIFKKTSFWKTNNYAISTIFSGIILIAAVIMDQSGISAQLTHAVYLIGIILGGYLPVRAGISMLIHARSIDMNVLMTIAVTGAVIIGQVEEGAMVVFLFSLGNTLQAYTLDKTRKSIRSLMELTPQQAMVKRDEFEIIMPVDNIKIGDIVVVRPGEKIPMDGIVAEGFSSVDQAAITGESIPVDKAYGDEVFAGTINQCGALEINVTRLAKDNTIARLIAMVDEAQGKRAESQEFIDRFAIYYTPAVISCAILVAIIPTLFLHQSFHKWVYEALAMLLVACPCALVVSTPVSIVTAIGNAAKNGILVKGGVYLEEMARLSVVAFDKTGTLTRGKPEVTDIVSTSSLTGDEVLSLSAAIESRSEHPLGASIVNIAKQHELLIPPVADFGAVIGRGATGTVNGLRYYVGNKQYARETNIDIEKVIDDIEKLENQGKTVILLCEGEKVLGLVALADILRPMSNQAVRDLKTVGIHKVIMLTGDNVNTARAIASEAGVDDFKAQLLPEDKVTAVQDLIKQYGKVAMIGDGVNDAPAMSIATVGIAMGAAGTDTALETADVALMADDLSKLSYAIYLSRKTLDIMKQNVIVALLIKGVILSLVVPGMLTMWLAVIGDMGASLLVILNGLRLIKVRPTN